MRSSENTDAFGGKPIFDVAARNLCQPQIETAPYTGETIACPFVNPRAIPVSENKVAINSSLRSTSHSHSSSRTRREFDRGFYSYRGHCPQSGDRYAYLLHQLFWLLLDQVHLYAAMSLPSLKIQ